MGALPYSIVRQPNNKVSTEQYSVRTVYGGSQNASPQLVGATLRSAADDAIKIINFWVSSQRRIQEP